MNTKLKYFLFLIASFGMLDDSIAAIYRCPNNTPIDALHNRQAWYVGIYTPQNGSYQGSLGTLQNLVVQADDLLDTANNDFNLNVDSSGDMQASLSSGSVDLMSQATGDSVIDISTLDTQSIGWRQGTSIQWPPAPVTGAMHALIPQRHYLVNSYNSARSSHALRFAKETFEYRIAGSSDTTIDGISKGQLTAGSYTLDVEVITQYFAPSGRGNNDYCNRLFHNRGIGFEIQMRPIVYILGENLSEAGSIPGASGDYSGRIELMYDAIPDYRPLY